MKYIFLNIRNLIRNEKFIFAVMLCGNLDKNALIDLAKTIKVYEN